MHVIFINSIYIIYNKLLLLLLASSPKKNRHVGVLIKMIASSPQCRNSFLLYIFNRYICRCAEVGTYNNIMATLFTELKKLETTQMSIARKIHNGIMVEQYSWSLNNTFELRGSKYMHIFSINILESF